MRDTRAEDVTLLYAAAVVARRHRLPGDNNVPGWDSVAKALDRMAGLLVGGPTGRWSQDQLDTTFAVVREHPGATSAQIGNPIGESRDRALSLLKELERRGLVTRKTGQAKTQWYPAKIFSQPDGEEGQQ